MCGISVILSPEKRNLAPHIRTMTDAIRHRGPDDEGFVLASEGERPRFLAGPDTCPGPWDGKIAYRPTGELSGSEGRLEQVAMGHRRLSILDLSPAGHQPMLRESAGHIVCYNGEIYNYLELRAELEAKGHRFHTGSDTEVLLCAYEEWGNGCLSRFNGMFAFVLYDSKAHRFLAARDRFAVKPLYYWQSPEGFLAFASEIKQFTFLPGWVARLNHQRAYDFLAYGVTDHTSETLFDGVRQLRGGELLTGAVGSACSALSATRWYELNPSPVEPGFEEASRTFRSLFDDSIRLRFRSDVPVGIALSGGLDSSSVVCTASELLKKKGRLELHTFSACAKQERFDESRYARSVVEKTGAEGHFIYPDVNGLFEALPKLVWHQDEPTCSTSTYAEWKIYELAQSAGIKVSLDGHGADEILAGYHSFFLPFYTGLVRRGRFLKLRDELELAHRLHGHSLEQVSKRFVLNNAVPRSYRDRKEGQVFEDWLNLSFLRASAVSPLEADPHRFRSIRNFSIDQVLCTSLPQQLRWADRSSMAHSIESRDPFLDYRLVEFLVSCPDELKIRKGQTKALLRRAMDGTLPAEIRNRQDKMGFVTPEEHWMRTEAPGRFLVAARQAIEQAGGVFKVETLERVRSIVEGRQPFSFLPWRVIAFGSWVDRFSIKTN